MRRREDIPGSSGIPGKWWLYLAKGLLLCLAAGIGVALLNLEATSWQQVASIPGYIILLLLLMVATAWFCNGMRTYLLARSFGHRLSLQRATGITLSMEFAIAATPGGLAGLPTRILLQRRSGIPVHQSMTMIAADASADILFFLLLSPFALRAVWNLPPVNDALRNLSWTDIGLAACGLVMLGIVIRLFLRRAGRFGVRLPRLRRLLVRMRREVRLMRHSVGYIWRHGRAWYFAAFVFCCVQWSCRYGILPVILWALGSPMDPFALVYLQGVLFIVALGVVVPGGGGSMEILSTLILQSVVGSSTAVLAVILWRLFTYYLYILGGSLAATIQIIRPARSAQSQTSTHSGQSCTFNDHPAA